MLSPLVEKYSHSSPSNSFKCLFVVKSSGIAPLLERIISLVLNENDKRTVLHTLLDFLSFLRKPINKYAVCVLHCKIVVGYLRGGDTGHFTKTNFYCCGRDSVDNASPGCLVSENICVSFEIVAWLHEMRKIPVRFYIVAIFLSHCIKVLAI